LERVSTTEKEAKGARAAAEGMKKDIYFIELVVPKERARESSWYPANMPERTKVEPKPRENLLSIGMREELHAKYPDDDDDDDDDNDDDDDQAEDTEAHPVWCNL
jgi:hypothetical protein